MSATTFNQTDWRPFIVAHRGLWKPHFPENSKEAFEFAREKTFSIVECDVWQSIDGEPIVIHDQTLDRTTTATGPVCAYSREELQKVYLRHGDAITHYPLRSLAEVAHLVSIVEIKPCDSPWLVRRVIELMADRRWMLQSFDESNLRHTMDYKPQIPVALLIEERARTDSDLSGFPNVHLQHDLLDEVLMSRLRASRSRVGVWTVNTAAATRRLLSLRPDLIITDEPELVVQTLREARVATCNDWEWSH